MNTLVLCGSPGGDGGGGGGGGDIGDGGGGGISCSLVNHRLYNREK